MIARNCHGSVPQPGAYSPEDDALLARAYSLIGQIRTSVETQAFHVALTQIWSVVSEANGYVDRQAPWALRKSDPARMGTVLYVLAEAIRRASQHEKEVCKPFTIAEKKMLLELLGRFRRPKT